MPIPYIIALILGVIVIALLGYWLIFSGGKGSKVGQEAECRGRMVEWCVTKITANRNKVDEVCGNIQTGELCDFCTSIIPKWDNTGC